MAEARTEAPTSRRLAQARLQGDVARSRVLVAVALLIAVSIALVWLWPHLLAQLSEFMADRLRRAPQGTDLFVALTAAVRVFALTVFPIVGVAVVVVLVTNLVQVGPLLTAGPLSPRFRLSNPINRQTFTRMATSLLLVCTVLAVAGGVLWEHAPLILGSVGHAPERALEATTVGLATLAVCLGALGIVVAAIDLVYQRISRQQRLKMTREEVAREQKETEANPQIQAQLRSNDPSGVS